jgi:hypothetical protein
MESSVNHDATAGKRPASSPLHDLSLKAAGYAYIVGDAAMFASGLLKASRLEGAQRSGMLFESATGALWGAGGLAAARYGNPDKEKQLEILAHKLEKFLVRAGATVDDSASRSSPLLSKNPGIIGGIERFLYEHPSEALNTVYALGAASMLRSGHIEGKNSKTMMGALVMAGALGGLLITEDKNARAKAADGSLIDKAVALVRESPLRASSTLYFINNIFTFQHAAEDRKVFASQPHMHGMKPHWFSFLCAAAYVVANGLLFISKRDQIDEQKFTPAELGALEQVAASLIAAQPPAVQKHLLHAVSGYLAEQKLVALSPEAIFQQVTAKVAAVQKAVTPAASWQAQIAAADATPSAPQR